MMAHRELKDLPNKQGFEFVGITSIGNEIPCYVHRSTTGCYIVLSAYTDRRIYSELIGWRELNVDQ